MNSPSPRRRVLLLEDDPAWQHLIAVGLAEHGIDVRCQTATMQALASVEPDVIQAVLLDLAPKRVDGLVWCRQVAAHASAHGWPVLALSLDDDEAWIGHVFAAGATDFFVKSLLWKLLAERINQLIDAAQLRCSLAHRQRRLDRAEGFAVRARQAVSQAQTLVGHDVLTGLLNRTGFIKAAQGLLEAPHPQPERQAALLVLNLDRFKRLNDALGSAVADAALQEVARRLMQAFRNVSNVVLGRLASDEFAILFTALHRVQAAEGAAQIVLNEVHKPMLCAEVECVLCGSVGIAMGAPATPIQTLLAQAGQAMSVAKQAGGHGYRRFAAPVPQGVVTGVDLETALHQALHRGELVLYYQPIINPRGRRLAGVEALMRWQRQGQLVAPADFIPVAEASGLIDKLGEWAIVEALKQMRRWRDAGVTIATVAVNIHAGNLERGHLPVLIARTLERTRLEPGVLELELTETGLMRDVAQALQGLQALKQLGVRLALDDFGTGYSSLAYLTQLPLDTLKIDRSFVRQLEHGNGQSQAVVRSITALAQALGLSTIAEGVETHQQLESLRGLGCQDIQGFLYARPMPAADLPGWLERFEGASGARVVEAGPGPAWA